MFNGFFMRVVLVHPNAKMPTRGTSSSAGLDFYTPEKVAILPGDSKVVDLGLKIEFPDGFVLEWRNKSGISIKRRGRLGGGGVIDADYQGSLMVELENVGDELLAFPAGNKIIQGLVYPVWTGEPRQVDQLMFDSERGEGGFGSTGSS